MLIVSLAWRILVGADTKTVVGIQERSFCVGQCG
jgi:hypothetical protein